jgi:hypothetical protein
VYGDIPCKGGSPKLIEMIENDQRWRPSRGVDSERVPEQHVRSGAAEALAPYAVTTTAAFAGAIFRSYFPLLTPSPIVWQPALSG